MKIKVALLGVLLANAIIRNPVYADPDKLELDVNKANQIDACPYDLTVEKDDSKPNHLVKLGVSVTMNPAISYQDGLYSPKNKAGANVTFKADVPEGWCRQNAIIDISTNWKGGKDFTINKATVNIGKLVTIGHDSTIFGYEKGDGALLISPGASVLQINTTYTYDWLRFKIAIESPMPLKVGRFNKNVTTSSTQTNTTQTDNKANEANNKLDQESNKLDNEKNDKRCFKIKNNLPALAARLGVVTDHLDIGLSGLARLTDYTHNSDPNSNKPISDYALTWGADLGVQCQILPKKFSITGQGTYVFGLGDYLPTLSGLQDDEASKEIVTVYYLDQTQNALKYIDAFGFGGTVEYCVTPKWTLSVRGSYLTTLEDSNKPGSAFLAQWNVIPKIAYKVNKYFTFSSGYTVVQAYKVDEAQNKGTNHKVSGTIKFSL